MMKYCWYMCVLLFAGTPVFADMENTRDQVRLYRESHEKVIIDDFVELLSIPNDAADIVNIRRNAEQIQSIIRARGFETQLLDVGAGSPVVYGELLTPGAELTLVIYAHYDGQPVQPGNWASDPFTPVLRDGMVESGGNDLPLTAPFNPESRLFARSAGDDKAPVIGLMYGIDALRANNIPLSINIKLFFDGEEEAGSPNLPAILTEYKELLKADLWLFCDGPVHQTRRWKLGYGVRGHTGLEMTVFGPKRPLHSGHYGNWAPNPVVMLNHLLASMRDEQGNILVEGYYEQVVPPSERELAAIAAAPDVTTQLQQELALGRSEGDDRLELRIMQPALNIRGFQAGGVGATARNIIVPEARASIGLRLVPNLIPADVQALVEHHIRAQGFHIVHEQPDDETLLAHEKVILLEWETGGYPALRTPMDHPLAVRVSSVLTELSGNTLVHSPTSGGSLPLHHIGTILETPVLMLPIANHDNNQHGRNENLRLQNLWDGIEIYAVLMSELGKR